MSRQVTIVHSCNMLNVVCFGLDRCRTGHTREQDSRTVKVAEVNTVSGIATDCSGTKSRASNKTPQNVYKAKEALISQTCPWNQMAG